jgi:hypothetical protein
MVSHADERSRVLGGLVCLGATLAAALFLYGITVQSYWALALPGGPGAATVPDSASTEDKAPHSQNAS